MLRKPTPYKFRRFRKGDIIVSNGQVGVFLSLGHHPDGGSCNDDSYFFVDCWCWLDDPDDYLTEDGTILNDGTARLARKSERNFLYSKIEKQYYV